MQRKLLIWLTVGWMGLLYGCATMPDFDTTGVDTSLTPAKAAQNIDRSKNKKVLWAGTILASENLEQLTQMEILAYPTDESGVPDLEGEALGRFIIENRGYLETADYRPGRQVTVVGTISRTRAGRVGEARYVYPVVTASQLHLWSEAELRPSEPQLHFGIGIMLH